MATNPKKIPPKKKSGSFAGELLDIIGWGIGQAALPVPDYLFGRKKKKKKK